MKAFWFCAALALFCPGPPLVAAEKKAPLKSFQIPFRLTTLHHIVVRVKINGKGPFNFIVDTGAPALYLAESVGKKLAVRADKEGWGTFDRLEIEGGAVESKVKGRMDSLFQLEGMNALGLAGIKLHGVLGYNILARYRMKLDVKQEKMTWTRLDFDPGLPKPLKGKAGAAGQAAKNLDMIGTLAKTLAPILLKKPRREVVPRGFLGIEVKDAGGKSEGVLIQKVLVKSPAAAAGLKEGDRVTHFQGNEVGGVSDFQRLAVGLRAGQETRFTVRRGESTHKIVVKVGEGL